MNKKNCLSCFAPFFYNDGEDWKTVCIHCYKAMKRKEQAMKAFEPEEKIIYREVIVYKDRIIKEKIPPEILSRLIRICHPDRHLNSELSNKITAWLLNQREK